MDSMIFNETLAMAIPLNVGSRNPKRGIPGGYSGFQNPIDAEVCRGPGSGHRLNVERLSIQEKCFRC